MTSARPSRRPPSADGSTEPTVIGLGNRALQIPSVLFLKPDGEFLVGEAAERRGLTEPDRLAREFKRRIGDHVPIMVAGAPFSPQALTAHLLRWVVDRATERMGEGPAEVILTHPANWGPFRLELLDQVAVMAGLGSASRCTEPEAAAAQYAAQNRVAPGDRVAVYDLGGGTFDACVLEKTDTGFQALGTPEGVEHLGGVDFDEAVLRHVLGALGAGAAALDPDDPAVTVGLARLRRDCVEAKEALSTDVDTLVPVALPGLSTTVRITRAEFELMIRPALTETVAAMRRALQSAHVEPIGAAQHPAGRRQLPDPAGQRGADQGVLRAHRVGHPPEARRRPRIGTRRAGGGGHRHRSPSAGPWAWRRAVFDRLRPHSGCGGLRRRGRE